MTCMLIRTRRRWCQEVLVVPILIREPTNASSSPGRWGMLGRWRKTW